MRNDAQAEAPSFEPLPDNTYDFVVEATKTRKSATGKDGINLTAVVETGPYKKRKVFEDFWISPESNAAMGIFFRQLGAMGLGDSFWEREPQPEVEDIAAELVGKRFRGSTKEEEYGGKKRNRFSDIHPPTASASAVQFDGVSQAAASVAALNTPTATPSSPSTPAASSAAEVKVGEVLPSPWDDATGPDNSGVPDFGSKPNAPF